MESYIQWVIGILIGLIAARFILQRFIKNMQKKQIFIDEYTEILNSPQYRVKRSSE